MEYQLLSKIFYTNSKDYQETYQKRFSSDSCYHFNFTIGEHPAFVIANFEMLEVITSIMQLDKLLCGLIDKVPSNALNQFIKKCLIDEIKLTNEIEGVHSTRREINDLIDEIKEDETNTNKNKRLHGLVKRYVMLLTSDNELSLTTVQDVRNIYDELVLYEIKKEDVKNVPDGQFFRKEGVEVLSSSQKVIHKGLMPESKIIEYMTKALAILNNNSPNSLINIAVYHYLFGYIHPFYDGNGRTSRFISSFMLSKHLTPIVSVGLSYTIKQNITTYYRSFKDANDPKNLGELTAFTLNFLEIIKQSIENLIKAISDKRDILEYYEDIVDRYNMNSDNEKRVLFFLIQNSLFSEKGLSIEELSKISKYSQSTIRSYIKKFPQTIFTIEYEGNKRLYDINFEEFDVSK